jgi:hypothetical protein
VANLGNEPASDPAAAASSVNPADPYLRQAQTFPKLTNEQIARRKFSALYKIWPKTPFSSNAGIGAWISSLY